MTCILIVVGDTWRKATLATALFGTSQDSAALGSTGRMGRLPCDALGGERIVGRLGVNSQGKQRSEGGRAVEIGGIRGSSRPLGDMLTPLLTAVGRMSSTVTLRPGRKYVHGSFLEREC